MKTFNPLAEAAALFRGEASAALVSALVGGAVMELVASAGGTTPAEPSAAIRPSRMPIDRGVPVDARALRMTRSKVGITR